MPAAVTKTEETLDIAEAALLLRAEDSTVMAYARSGELPGARIGKAWVFLREDVLSFLRQKIASETDERRRKQSVPPAAFAVTAPRRRGNPIPVLPPLTSHK